MPLLVSKRGQNPSGKVLAEPTTVLCFLDKYHSVLGASLLRRCKERIPLSFKYLVGLHKSPLKEEQLFRQGTLFGFP